MGQKSTRQMGMDMAILLLHNTGKGPRKVVSTRWGISVPRPGSRKTKGLYQKVAPWGHMVLLGNSETQI